MGGDPARLAVAGDSAGAVLAAGVALRARDAGAPVLVGQLLVYGSCNYPSYPDGPPPSMIEHAAAPMLRVGDLDFFWGHYLRDPATEQDHPLASPVRAPSHAGLVPAFIQTAECDPSRDDAERYGAVLKAAGVPVEVRRYAGMPHGFLSWLGVIDGARTAINDASAWLKARFAAART